MWLQSAIVVILLLAIQSSWSSTFESLPAKLQEISATIKVPKHKPATTCRRIANSISSASDVHYPGSPEYDAAMSHYAISSTQHAACAVEPATNNDVGITLKILGHARTPFAVKSGGYSMNPSFSSTTGVHISLNRFRDITIHAGRDSRDLDPHDDDDDQMDTGNDVAGASVSIGPALLWNEVYDHLEHTGIGVAGGRVLGVGVGGYTLGGGYSWHTPQHGLAIDTLLSMDVVFPNGTVAEGVSSSYLPEVFFGLKGSFNNFGIVTRFRFKTFTQTDVWAGQIIYDARYLPAITAALADFAANNTDARAGLINTFAYLPTQGGMLNALLVFYDGPNPPPNVFACLLAIPAIANLAKTQSFAAFIRTLGSATGNRGLLSSISVRSFPESFLNVVVNETKFWGERLASKSAISITYNMQPFLPDIFTHTTLQSAYPPSRAQPFYPLDINWAWADAAADSEVYQAVKISKVWLESQAATLMPNDDELALYPNYALPWTPLDDLYGSHLPRLRALRRELDPERVMDLAGGFKV